MATFVITHRNNNHYKSGQIYYKSRQPLLLHIGTTIITNLGSLCYYTWGQQVLQIAAAHFITNRGNYYKSVQNNSTVH